MALQRYPVLASLVTAAKKKKKAQAGGMCLLCEHRPAQVSDMLQLCPDCAESISFARGLGLDYASASVNEYKRYEILNATDRVVATVNSASEADAMKAYRHHFPNGDGIKARLSATQRKP